MGDLANPTNTARAKAEIIREKGVKVFDSSESKVSYGVSHGLEDGQLKDGPLGKTHRKTSSLGHVSYRLGDNSSERPLGLGLSSYRARSHAPQSIGLGLGPQQQPNQQPSSPPTPLRMGLQQSRKERKADILLVEDIQVCQRVAQLALKRAGFKAVDVVDSGEEAVRQFKVNNYKIVLMDIMLPQMSGLTAAKLIREYERKNKLRHKVVIFGLTTSTSPQDLREYREAKMNGCIAKGKLIAESVKDALTVLKDDPRQFVVMVEDGYHI